MILAYDRSSLNSMRHVDENGFMHVDVCNITKEQVAPYYGREIPGYEEAGLDPDKIYYGYRPFEEIEKAAETFNNLPLLSQHVEDGADKDTQKYRVGSIGTDAKANKPYLTNSLAIYDKEAIEGIESGEKKELSCAYRYDPVFEPGEFDGQRYDFRMTNIRGNHVALVKEGRAGSDVVVADNNTINIGDIMSQKLKALFEKMSGKKIAMDEDLEVALKEAIHEQVKEIIAEENPEEKIEDKVEVTKDAEGGTDKRKLIDEVGGILKGKVDEELWRTVIGKLEKIAYTDSTASADDAAAGQQANDAEPAEEPKKDEEKQEVKAMDANSIREAILAEFKAKNTAAQEVRHLIGNVDPLAFDCAEDIYAKALELKGIETSKFDKSAYRGMVEVLKGQRTSSSMALDAKTTDSLMSDFPELSKIKLGA